MTDGDVLEPESDDEHDAAAPPITEAEIDAFTRGLDGFEADVLIVGPFLVIPSHGLMVRLDRIDAVEESTNGFALLTLSNSGENILVMVQPHKIVDAISSAIVSTN